MESRNLKKNQKEEKEKINELRERENTVLDKLPNK